MIIMEVSVINLYNDIAPPGEGFIADHGQSFYFAAEAFKVLFDTGTNGKTLLHNMEIAGVDPNTIETLVLSHGHYDHTGGLRELLKKRTTKHPLKIIAHPDVYSKKVRRKKKWFHEMFQDIGFPPMPEALTRKVSFTFTRDFYAINNVLFVTGEITERPYKAGISEYHFTKQNDKWLPDKMKDDMSLILKTKEGLVVFCGCCHAGLLNTLGAIRKHFPDEKFQAILGGTHMYQFTRAEVALVVKKLKESFDKPKLFFNHCSGLNTIELLKELYDKELVSDCLVGSKFVYDC